MATENLNEPAWEADEIRAGVRKIPGFAGHVPGVRNIVGFSFGQGTAKVLGNANDEALQTYPSAILRNRNDAYSTRPPANTVTLGGTGSLPLAKRSRIIPGYAGHQPGWQHTFGKTTGTYGVDKYMGFTSTTRRVLRTKGDRPPLNIFDLPDPPRDEVFVPLYPSAKGYIPGVTCYVPAMRERAGKTFGELVRDGFAQPVPRIAAPLTNAEDGKRIPHLELPSGYGGTIPRVLPEHIPGR